MALAPGAGWLASRAARRAAGGPSPAAGPTAAILLAFAVALAAALGAPAHAPSAASLVLGWTLLALALADLAAMRLPDPLTLGLTAAGLVVTGLSLGSTDAAPAFAPDTLASHVVGAAAGYLAFAALAWGFRKARGREGLGLGDAKLAAAAGAWLGWRPLPLVVLAACGLGFAWVGVRLAARGPETLRRPLAFGVPLALAIWGCWLARADLWAVLS
jgi:leader peptidase (prepilin peptidase)/N-methyltransferase